jgi:membrane-associated phospholipid phosphatase
MREYSFSEQIKSNSVVYIFSVTSYILMSATAFIFPIGFSEFRITDNFAQFWYLVTESGSFISGLIIYIFLIIFLVIRFKNSFAKNSDLVIYSSVLFFTFVFSTGLNEFVLKEFIQKPRPNQIFLVEKGYINIDAESFLRMPGSEKKEFLNSKFKTEIDIPEKIYPPVFDNWKSESGFSMPSGHALISYFLGTIICFVIYKTFKGRKKILILIPLVWCMLVSLSRVITGMHYPPDIMAGAFTGMMFGFIINSLPVSKRLFN